MVMLTTIKKTALVLLAIIVYPNNVMAHDEAIQSGWCEGGEVAILGNFQLNGNFLRKFKGEENPVCTQLKSCGQFEFTIDTINALMIPVIAFYIS